MSRFFKLGDHVKVTEDNDNEGYNSFRNKELEIIHVATNEKEHPGYDNTMKGMPLYDFIDAETGSLIGSSLYFCELETYNESLNFESEDKESVVDILGDTKKYIEDNYTESDLENNYHDYDNNPRLDDCFNGGYEKGYARALYDIGKILAMELNALKDIEEEQ